MIWPHPIRLEQVKIYQSKKKPPVLLNSSTERNFFTLLSANWLNEDNFCKILLHSKNTASRGSRADINHQNLSFSKFLYLNLRKNHIWLKCTLLCFSPSVFTPSSLRSKKKLISSSVKISGNFPTSPSTWPTSLSALQRVGSILVPTPIRPPGTAYLRSFSSIYN